MLNILVSNSVPVELFFSYRVWCVLTCMKIPWFFLLLSTYPEKIRRFWRLPYSMLCSTYSTMAKKGSLMHFLYLNHLQNRNLRKKSGIAEWSDSNWANRVALLPYVATLSQTTAYHLAGSKTQRILSESVQLLGNHWWAGASGITITSSRSRSPLYSLVQINKDVRLTWISFNGNNLSKIFASIC